MAVILAFDTSTEACSCALSLHGEIHEHYRHAPRQHAQILLPMIHSLMAEHGVLFTQLDALAFGRGPGSFTGLRIAAGVAQGIAFAASLPAVPVSSLAAIAGEAFADTDADRVFACLDARIDEVYWGWYRRESGLPVLCDAEGLCRPEQLPAAAFDHSARVAAAGDGLVYRARFPHALSRMLQHERPGYLPRAGWVARLAESLFAQGQVLDAEAIRPVYLRDQVTRQLRES